MTECPICLNPINSACLYAMIDNVGETGKYHIACLQEWLKIKKSGILIQNPISTYTIYDNDQYIITVNVNDNFIMELENKSISKSTSVPKHRVIYLGHQTNFPENHSCRLF